MFRLGGPSRRLGEEEDDEPEHQQISNLRMIASERTSRYPNHRFDHFCPLFSMLHHRHPNLSS
jgi:hypothetical protein